MNFVKSAVCWFGFLLTNFVCAAVMEFVPIPAGELTVGGTRRPRLVKLTQSFEMQTTEVTQLQYFEVMKANPSSFKRRYHCPDEHRVVEKVELCCSRFTPFWPRGEHRVVEKVELCPHHPVEWVDWNAVQDFLAKLNRQKNDRYTYRLPTEAEWLYAARAGTKSHYYYGNGTADLEKHAWFWGKSNRGTHAVGKKEANPWGLYDVHGNVWEWVQDCYAKEMPSGENPVQTQCPGTYKVGLGGSWANYAQYLRFSYRHHGFPVGHRQDNVGFRLVRTLK